MLPAFLAHVVRTVHSRPYLNSLSACRLGYSAGAAAAGLAPRARAISSGAVTGGTGLRAASPAAASSSGGGGSSGSSTTTTTTSSSSSGGGGSWQQLGRAQAHQHAGSGGGRRGARGWGAAGAALGAAAAALAPAAALAEGSRLTSDGVEPGNSKLLSLDTRRRIFFKYEKRIRDMSTLEKTYEYFATQVDASGAKAMDVRDVVRAVVPTYPANDTNIERAGFLDGERGVRLAGGIGKEPRNSVFRIMDDDGNGVFSFDEFRLVVLLLSIPEADINVVFSVVDTDGSGTISADEFDKVFSELERRAGMQQRFHARVGKNDNTGGAKEKSVGNVARSLFGSNRRGTMNLKRFQAFLTQLHADVTRLEFAHYDSNGDGYISGLDFGNSIAGAADINHVDTFLDRVAAMEPRLRDARISFSDFTSLATVRRHLHRLTYALEFCARIGRPVDKSDFTKLTQRLVGVKLSPDVVDILFAVCDGGGGALDGHGFVKLMRAREKMPGRKSSHFQESRGELGPVGRLFSCFKDCVIDPDERVDQPEAA